MNNWDKPLTWKQFDERRWSQVMEYHGTEWTKECELRKLNSNASCDEESYKIYLNYCKVMSSPLGQALL